MSAITTQRWSAWDDLKSYAELGIHGIGLWRHKLDGVDLAAFRAALDSEGMRITNLCFSGQFTLGVREALEDGIRALEQAAQLGAPSLLIISGPVQSRDIEAEMRVVMEGMQQLAERAKVCGVKLALEALHPMDMTQWTAIPTVSKALELVDAVDDPTVGLMLDFYNSWWDPSLLNTIAEAGPRILSVQMADWRNPTRSFTDRTVPGRGVAGLERMIQAVESTGYQGFYDLEIFSDEIWGQPENYSRIIQEALEWWSRVGDSNA